MLDLIEQSALAVDELIDVMGRATIEAVLLMSAEQVAGPRTPGKKGGSVRWYGRQDGVVTLSDRKLRVIKPRLRTKGAGPAARCLCRRMRRCSAMRAWSSGCGTS
jgi:hypothetical protein